MNKAKNKTIAVIAKDVVFLLVVNINMGDSFAINILNELRSDPVLGQIPVLALVDDNFVIPTRDNLFVDDYLRKSCFEVDMLSRVDSCMYRAERMVGINPLTRLPGNIAIMKQVQKRLNAGEIFALA